MQSNKTVGRKPFKLSYQLLRGIRLHCWPKSVPELKESTFLILFSPIAKMTTMRLLLSLASILNW
ncbi:hypothetical protein CR513_10033, partial [Mucuna pruriens]